MRVPYQAAGDPSDSPAVAQFLGRSNRLISKARVGRLDHSGDAMDLVAAMVDAVGLVEDAIVREDLVDGGAATSWIVFTKDVIKIAGSAESISRRTRFFSPSPESQDVGLRRCAPESARRLGPQSCGPTRLCRAP